MKTILRWVAGTLWLLCAARATEELPLLGLARVTIRVSDLEKARAFYGAFAGFEEASVIKANGAVAAVYFKVNDLQFIEVIPGLAPTDVVPMTSIAIRTDQIEKLRAALMRLGAEPGEIAPARDGSRAFTISRLPGQNLGALEFVQYGPDSIATRTKGRFLGTRRLSTHLEHAGIIATDFEAAYDFYVKVLGCHETWRRLTADRSRVVIDHLGLPGASGDFVELSNQTGAQAPLTRTRAGGAAHLALEVPEMKAVAEEVRTRNPAFHPAPPRYGLDNRWNFNLFDPDSTRLEFMQTEDPAHRAPAIVVTPPDFGKERPASK